MKRWSGLAAVAVLLMAAGPAMAGKKSKKKALEPVKVQVTNACKTELAVKLGELAVKVPAGATTEVQEIAPKDDWSYALWMNGDKPIDLGLLSLQPGGDYEVGLMGCRDGAADIYTKDRSEKPKALSPNAASEYRFRARSKVYLEYKAGPTGRFRPLSVAMTRYKEAAAGDLPFTLRLRAAKQGPVLNTFNGSVGVDAGHRYLIEANVVGRNIFYKWEDEGWRKD
jgi:hypothetical protein